MPKLRILVVDDDSLMREFVEEAMRRAGHSVESASTGKEGLRLFAQRGHDLVVTDLKMTPVDGLEVLRQARELDPSVPVIVMTGYGTIETAVTALKEGAADYVLKPITPEALELSVDRAIDRTRLSRENRYLREEISAQYDFDAMIGASPAMQEIYSQVRKVASTKSTILIRGESGTGKELVARAIHEAGPRKDKPMIKVNCAALSAGILESELFGHEKGAFTSAHERKVGRFELADKGTLLLDEVSEIGMALQSKLLRALQEREFERVGGTSTIQVDTRILATSNRNLEKAVESGSFREDLFFRLNVITIEIPPLRQRRDDIPALLDHFLARFNRETGRSVEGFTEAAREHLLRYPWPGNVRELQNAVERAVVLSESPLLEPAHFQLEGAMIRPPGRESLSAGTTVAEMERELIFLTLERCGDHRAKAAEMLGISVRTLRNKLNEYEQAKP